MVVAIIAIAVIGVFTVGKLKGWFGTNEITVTKEDGKWKGAPSSLFEYELSGKVFTTGGNTFYATEPGVVQTKVTGLGKTAQLDITSTYVATVVYRRKMR